MPKLKAMTWFYQRNSFIEKPLDETAFLKKLAIRIVKRRLRWDCFCKYGRLGDGSEFLTAATFFDRFHATVPFIYLPKK